jgi:hypothetical protein
MALLAVAAGLALCLAATPGRGAGATDPRVADTLPAVIEQLQAHLDGVSPLAAGRLLDLAALVQRDAAQVGRDRATIRRATMMRDWDTALDTVSGLFGYPAVRPKSVLYLQIDVIQCQARCGTWPTEHGDGDPAVRLPS